MNTDIQKSLDVLRSGGVILYPTDTVWGLGCDATNEKAVTKIFKIKKRAESKSLIVLVADEQQLLHYVPLPAAAKDLISNAAKPLTIIYESAVGLASAVIAQDGSVGIRIVKDKFCQRLIKEFGKPIVSTSANVSNYPTPLTFNEIAEEIKQQVNYVVQWKQQENRKANPSTIIKLSANGTVEYIRK